MSRKRLLVIGPDPERSQGGMASIIRNILNNGTIGEEYEVTMYPSFIDGSAVRRGLYFVARELRFRSLGRGYDVYHIHICSGTSTWRKMRYVRRLGSDASKVVLHVHGARYHLFYEQCSDAQRRRIRDLYASVAKVVVLSEEWRDWFVENEVCDPRKLEVLYNAVEVPPENRTDYAKESVLFMGRLGERKSPDVLLRAAAKVLPAHPSARFVFGGDGDVDTYRRMAEELGVADRCEFLGWVSGEAKEQAFLGSSVYCLPSKDEGMPMSVLEAMSYGLATVSTPVGGMPQVIDDRVDGLFFPVGDVDALAELLDGLLASNGERARLGAAGRRKVEEKFSMDAYGRRLSRIYGEVCS